MEPVPFSEDATSTSLLMMQAGASSITTAQGADLDLGLEKDSMGMVDAVGSTTLAFHQNVEAILAVTKQAAEDAEASLRQQVAGNTYTGDASALEMTETSKQISASPLEATAPSVRKILTFAIPAIGVWLCNPLLSLIDTSAVGIMSGTAQQAALNPATAVTDYAALLIVREV
jgi:hypothetical protein